MKAGYTDAECLDMGNRHSEWCTHLCQKQRENGMYFLYENLVTSNAWDKEGMRELVGSKHCTKVDSTGNSYLRQQGQMSTSDSQVDTQVT